MGFAVNLGWLGGFAPSDITIPNKSWETGDAGGWTLSAAGGGAACYVQTDSPRTGTYCLRISAILANAAICYAEYEHPDYKLYAGQRIEFSIYNQLRSGYGTGVSRYIEIDDGINNTQQLFSQSYDYVKTTVRHTVDSNPSRLRFQIYVSKPSTGNFYWYIDDMDAKIV